MYDIYIVLLLIGLYNMINIYNIMKLLLCLCMFVGVIIWGIENLKELLNNKYNKVEIVFFFFLNYLGMFGFMRMRNNK